MKDINKLKDYREKYKRYYNIDFDFEKVLEEADKWIDRKYRMDMGYKEAYDMFEKYTKKRHNNGR